MHIFIINDKVEASSARGRAFSLVEMIVAAAIGGILMIQAINIIVSHTRTVVRSESVTRLQESWSRVQFFLDQEIQESIGIPVITGCSLRVMIPTADGGSTPITYTLSGKRLRRTGPSISTDGTLIEGTTSTENLVDGVSHFCAELRSESGVVIYTMTLQDSNGVTYSNKGGSAGVRPRARNIN